MAPSFYTLVGAARSSIADPMNSIRLACYSFGAGRSEAREAAAIHREGRKGGAKGGQDEVWVPYIDGIWGPGNVQPACTRCTNSLRAVNIIQGEGTPHLGC